MSERTLHGLAASGGTALGPALVVRDDDPATSERGGGAAEQTRALGALARVAEELGRLAEIARAAGRTEEAEILEANLLMAEDPSLQDEIRARAADAPAAVAVREATSRHASLLAGLDDPLLAARAADVRQLGRRAARLLTGAPAVPAPTEPSIVLARDLGPADVAELELAGGLVLGIALVEGAATSHVAIMARALGLPMAVALGDQLLDASDGELVVLGEGDVVLSPGESRQARARTSLEAQESERRALAAGRAFPAETRDGRAITLLCNAVTSAEVVAGLAAGAVGVGLLRTELAFLDAAEWPEEDEHFRALAPPLEPLEGRVATVRTLDFGADKTPPFLAGIDTRGLALALSHPKAFAAQLRAILRAGAKTRLRVLLPLVESADELKAAEALFMQALEAVAWSGRPPQLGAMIETPAAAGRTAEIATVADFVSIGTNDLVQYTLGLDRELPAASTLAAADPQVLARIAEIVDAAHEAGLQVEVCGEAAGEPEVAALLVGIGADELSASPARLDRIRATIRSFSAADARAAADTARSADSALAALEIARSLLRSGKPGDEVGQALDGLGSVLA